MASREPSYFRAALLMPANLVGLLAAGAASLAASDPTAVLVAVGVESLYLGLMTTSRRFRRAVRARELDAEDEPISAEALLAELSASQKEHYLALKELRSRILASYRKLPGGRVLAASSEPRLDGLLAAFLRLLATLNGYRQYLGGADRERLEGELALLEAEVAAEGNVRIREVKQKRVEILQKRIQRFLQAEESRELVSHQLAGIEDLLRLTHEQSIAIRDPEQVSRQLDALAAEASATEETVREMERFMELTEPAPSLPLPTRVR